MAADARAAVQSSESTVSGLRLLVVPPLSGKTSDELKASARVLSAVPSSDARRLKDMVLEAFRGEVKHLTPCDMTLYFQNREGAFSQRLELMDESDSLSMQGVRPGALVVCQLVAWDRPTSKLVADSAYYAWAACEQVVPDEIRVQQGGAPVLLSQEAPAPAKAAKPTRILKHYSWIDESRSTVKLYISADAEPEAVAAARGPEDARVEADFGEQRLEVRILGENVTYVLVIEVLEHRVLPERCSFKLVAGRRLVVSLRKEKEDALWNTLYRRR